MTAAEHTRDEPVSDEQVAELLSWAEDRLRKASYIHMLTTRAPLYNKLCDALRELQSRRASSPVGSGERMWCRSCGTVTRDNTCDCTRLGMNTQTLVNYADAGWDEVERLVNSPPPSSVRKAALEAAAKIVERWSTADKLRLHCGEMTAQEVQTVLAICGVHAEAIRALIEAPPHDP